jgi:divinyl protochlorophyllide a 8-vinyl-reductase
MALAEIVTDATPAEAGVARIGPNAVIRLQEALTADDGAALAARVFARAGLDGHLHVTPTAMVAEAEVIRLYRALEAELGVTAAAAVAAEAGRRTGDYLLAHRIPKPAQALLTRLPGRLAGRLLLAAIARNAWTFAGSGTVTTRAGGGRFVVDIADAPGCRVAALRSFYAGTFAQLFRQLLHRRAPVRPVAAADGRAWSFPIGG